MPKNYGPFPIVNAVSMAASITSSVVDARYLQQLKFQVVYTGTPTGTFSLQESMDYSPVSGGGTWLDNGSGIAAAAGAGGSTIVNLSNRGPSFYRLVYTRTSGTGSLSVYAGGAGF